MSREERQKELYDVLQAKGGLLAIGDLYITTKGLDPEKTLSGDLIGSKMITEILEHEYPQSKEECVPNA
jgi:hypothetical protein